MKDFNVIFILNDGKVIQKRVQATDKNQALSLGIATYDLEDLDVASIHIAEFLDDNW